jgi:hypothetical protein
MKLFIYPTARTHSHDLIKEYHNTTPLSKQGINKHCTVVSTPDEADFFYIGQISDGTMHEIKQEEFSYLRGNEHKHIVTIEGDWANNTIPDYLLGCIFTGNGMKDYSKTYKYCARPCMSKLLVHLAKNNVGYDLNYSCNKSFGFKGQYDIHGTRAKIYKILHELRLPNEMSFNNTWLGSINLEENFTIQEYAKIFKNNLLSLCPRGAGEDTIRFYEACFFGRVPIIIGDTKIMNEDNYDCSFIFKISPNATDDCIKDFFNAIYNTPQDILEKKAKQARLYFDNIVKDYFQDPTANFINFLKYHNLYSCKN